MTSTKLLDLPQDVINLLSTTNMAQKLHQSHNVKITFDLENGKRVCSICGTKPITILTAKKQIHKAAAEYNRTKVELSDEEFDYIRNLDPAQVSRRLREGKVMFIGWYCDDSSRCLDICGETSNVVTKAKRVFQQLAQESILGGPSRESTDEGEVEPKRIKLEPAKSVEELKEEITVDDKQMMKLLSSNTIHAMSLCSADKNVSLEIEQLNSSCKCIVTSRHRASLSSAVEKLKELIEHKFEEVAASVKPCVRVWLESATGKERVSDIEELSHTISHISHEVLTATSSKEDEAINIHNLTNSEILQIKTEIVSADIVMVEVRSSRFTVKLYIYNYNKWCSGTYRRS